MQAATTVGAVPMMLWSNRMFGRRARLPTVLIVLAAALAGCGQSPPYEASLRLLPKAAPLCADSFARGRLTSTPAPGSVKGPAIVYGQFDYSQIREKYRDSDMKTPGEWFVANTDIVLAYAKKVDGVQTSVCIRHAYIQIGIYQPNDIAAVRYDWDIRVLRWPSGETLASTVVRGQGPPPEIKLPASQIGKRYYGDAPDKEAKRWLNELIQ